MLPRKLSRFRRGIAKGTITKIEHQHASPSRPPRLMIVNHFIDHFLKLARDRSLSPGQIVKAS